MSDKPNVTVIFQDAKPSPPTFWQIVKELLFFLLLAGLVGLVMQWRGGL